MQNDLSTLTETVLAKSADFASRMRRDFPSLLCDVGHYSNEAFLLRSFVGLRADNQGDELALTIDVAIRPPSVYGIDLTIESDLCLEDGTIVATGPAAKFDSASPTFVLDVLGWGEAFDVFVAESQKKLSLALAAIVAARPA